MSKSAIAAFLIKELRYDNAPRNEIIEALMDELWVSKSNAAAYIYNFDKKNG